MHEVFEKILEKLEQKSSEKIYQHECDDYYIGIIDAIDIVKQEAEQYNNGWIPCSERLPEEGGYYLVTYHGWSNGDYLPKFDDTYVRRLHYQRSEHFVGWNYPHCVDEMAEADTNREVIAWMNLPAPYQPKGEQHEKS